MAELGLNFILATELRQILESKFNICLTQEDLQNMSFLKLHELIDEKGTLFQYRHIQSTLN